MFAGSRGGAGSRAALSYEAGGMVWAAPELGVLMVSDSRARASDCGCGISSDLPCFSEGVFFLIMLTAIRTPPTIRLR